MANYKNVVNYAILAIAVIIIVYILFKTVSNTGLINVDFNPEKLIGNITGSSSEATDVGDELTDVDEEETLDGEEVLDIEDDVRGLAETQIPQEDDVESDDESDVEVEEEEEEDMVLHSLVEQSLTEASVAVDNVDVDADLDVESEMVDITEVEGVLEADDTLGQILAEEAEEPQEVDEGEVSGCPLAETDRNVKASFGSILGYNTDCSCAPYNKDDSKKAQEGQLELRDSLNHTAMMQSDLATKVKKLYTIGNGDVAKYHAGKSIKEVFDDLTKDNVKSSCHLGPVFENNFDCKKNKTTTKKGLNAYDPDANLFQSVPK